MSGPATLEVFVRGLEIEAGIGVHAHEHGRLQRLVLDVSLTLAPVTVTRLDDTYDYERIAAAARGLVAAGHIGLVETFAQDLAAALAADPRVMAVRVRVEKPGALGGAAAPGCEIAWRRDPVATGARPGHPDA